MLTQYKTFKKNSDISLESKSEQTQELISIPQTIPDNNQCIDRKILREIGWYTLSNSLTPTIDNGFIFIGILILANKSLPASALIGVYQDLITTTGCTMLGASCAIVSNAYGEKERMPDQAIIKIRYCLKSGVVFALILSGPAISLALSSKGILRWLNQPEELLDSVEKYFYYFSWGMPAIFIAQLQKQIVIGLGDVKSINILSIFDNVSNSVLGYLLVNGILGGEEMGAAGLGLSASIVNWSVLISLSIYFKKSGRFKGYGFNLFGDNVWSDREARREVIREIKKVLKELVILGVPIGLQAACEFAFLLIYTAFYGNLGVDALIAYQICSQYIRLAGIPTYGLNQSVIFLVGRETGANRIHSAKKIGMLCITMGGGITLMLCGIMSTMTKELMRPFINVETPEYEEAVAKTRILFFIQGATQTFDAVRIISAGAIQGAFKQTRCAMISGIINTGMIGLSLAWLLGFPAYLGVIGVAVGQGIGVSCGAGTLFLYLRNKIKNWYVPAIEFVPLEQEDDPNTIKSSAIVTEDDLEVNEELSPTTSISGLPNNNFLADPALPSFQELNETKAPLVPLFTLSSESQNRAIFSNERLNDEKNSTMPKSQSAFSIKSYCTIM